MATTLPSPQFTTFFTNEEIEEARRDIALLSFLLAQVTHEDNKKDSGHKSPARPKLDAIQPWAYLAFMLTAGNEQDRHGNKVVAVTGKVEHDAFAAALVTPNVSLRHSHDHLSISELKPNAKTGRNLLSSDPSSITTDVSFSQHATDVLSILQYLFSPLSDQDPLCSSEERIPRLTLFISRRCYRKLRARADRGTHLWRDHPLKLIHAWYHAPQTTSGAARPTTPLASKQFELPSKIKHSLARSGIHADQHQSSSSSAKGKVTYTVSQDTAKLWTGALHNYMETMLVSYTSTPWTKHSVAAFWEAIATFRETLTKGILDHLITPELAKYLSEEGQHGSQRRPRLEAAILEYAPVAAPAHSAVAGDMPAQGNSDRHAVKGDRGANDEIGNVHEDDHHNHKDSEDSEDDSDADPEDDYENEPDNDGFDNDKQPVAITDGPGALKQPVLRYLRTLCIAIDAATFYTSYAKRLAKRDLQLQAYLVSSKPSIVPITSATVREFAGKFMKHFSPSLEQVKGVAPAFEKLARSVDKASFNAVEHVEAILMAVACDSAGTDVGPSPDLELNSTATTTTTTPATTAIRSIFEVTPVPVGVSKKCCFCCHKLALLLKEHAGLDFVLQGMHSIILPWIPPRGIPVKVLVELRLTLLRVLYDTVKEAAGILQSTQTSPAGSVVSQASADYDYYRFFSSLPDPMVVDSQSGAAPMADVALMGDDTDSVHTQEGL